MILWSNWHLWVETIPTVGPPGHFKLRCAFVTSFISVWEARREKICPFCNCSVSWFLWILMYKIFFVQDVVDGSWFWFFVTPCLAYMLLHRTVPITSSNPSSFLSVFGPSVYICYNVRRCHFKWSLLRGADIESCESSDSGPPSLFLCFQRLTVTWISTQSKAQNIQIPNGIYCSGDRMNPSSTAQVVQRNKKPSGTLRQGSKSNILSNSSDQIHPFLRKTSMFEARSKCLPSLRPPKGATLPPPRCNGFTICSESLSQYTISTFWRKWRRYTANYSLTPKWMDKLWRRNWKSRELHLGNQLVDKYEHGKSGKEQIHDDFWDALCLEMPLICNLACYKHNQDWQKM